MTSFLLTLLGLLLLTQGGNFLIKGAIKLSALAGISKFVVSTTVVAFCTSAPELIVGIKSVLSNHPEIAFGNVVGSNIANIGLVLGISAFLMTIKVSKKNIITDWSVSMLSTLLFIFLGIYGKINTLFGFIFLALFIFYILIILRKSKKEKKDNTIDRIPKTIKNYGISFSLLIIGSIFLSFGSNFLIDGASSIAKAFNISEYIIGITVVAIGTSVPELATSIIASLKKETDLSLGNIIGSNIFNIFVVMGASSLFKTMIFPDYLKANDFYWLIGINILFTLILFFGTKINWKKGILLLTAYIIYTLFTIL